MTKARLLLVPFLAPLALGLAACGGSQEQQAEPPLAGAAIGGSFELTDATGKTVRWSDFDGSYRIVYFGYAYCPDVCPLDVQRMVQGLNLFAESEPGLANQVKPIFITIDPERDTPEVLAEFTKAFSDDLIGLTGPVDAIDTTAKAFGAYYARGEEQPGGGYLMDHSRAAYLMGRKGEPIALLPVDQSGQAVAAELEKWVR